MTPERLAVLALVLDELIPPSTDGRLPGAGELGLAATFAERADLVPLLESGLDALDEVARGAHGGGFAETPPEERRAVVARIRDEQPAFFSAVFAQTLVGYYQHPRVLVGIGLEGRPPFPLGFAVPPTDFSILDPVRSRAPFFRTP